MSVELQMLGWSILLGVVYVLLAVTLATQQRGLSWNTGNRTGACARRLWASKTADAEDDRPAPAGRSC